MPPPVKQKVQLSCHGRPAPWHGRPAHDPSHGRPGHASAGRRCHGIESLEPRLLFAAALDPSLTTWFRADTIAAAPNAAVSSWTDSSGHGFNASQATPANQPHLLTNAINGLPAVHFDAAASTQLAFARPVSGDFTIVVVFRSTQGISHSQAWYDGAGLVDGEVSGITNDLGLSLNSLGQVSAGTGKPDTFLDSGMGFNDGKPHVATFVRTAAFGTLQLYVDGNLFKQSVGGTQPLVAPPRFTIGSTQTNLHYFTGDIGEIQLYTTALPAGTRTAVETSLESDYGIGALTTNWFTNPVINTDFPDPSAINANGFYYAYATNSNGRNAQVQRSTDLVHWTQLSDALPTLPTWAQAGRTWAADVALMADGVHYNMYFTAWSASTGRQAVGVATSTNPAGPFTPTGSAPFVAQTSQGGTIDSSVYTDTDGTRYLLWKNDGNAVGQTTYLYIQQLSADGLTLLGSATQVIHQDQSWEGSLVEAPTLWKHDGKYFLFYSANAYNTAKYAIGYAVSNSLLGPYTKPAGPLVSTENGVTGPGGEDIVIGPDGNTWMLYHSWENNFAYRSTSVDRLDWVNDVPVLRGPSRFTQPVPTAPTVTSRNIFYNNSLFDGNDPTANAADDAAIAPDKQPLLPGQTATFANYTSYLRGINGLMIDVSALPAGTALVAADFTFTAGTNPDPSTWSTAPAPSSITLRRNAGTAGSDRITLVWPDNAIQSKWLRVTLKPDANTALATADTFYFGNLPGDANGNGIVTIADIGLARSLNGQSAPLTSVADFNRNGLITIADVAIAQAMNGLSIPLLSSPAAAPALAAPAATAFSSTVLTPPTWWDDWRVQSRAVLSPVLR